jgi:hypothetical protein
VSTGFTKLFASLLDSTVWCENAPTKITWICMLAMSDRFGRVHASIPGLANRARVTIPEAEAALAKFLAPDTYSRTKDHEGRRIEEIDGGWRLLNYEKYRAMRDEEERRAYNREWMRQHRGSPQTSTSSTVDSGVPPLAHAEAEAEAEAEERGREDARRPRPARKCPQDWSPDPRVIAQLADECPRVDLQRELLKFRDHTFARAIVDWTGAFRNWVRRTAETNGHKSLSTFEAQRRLMERS